MKINAALVAAAICLVSPIAVSQQVSVNYNHD